MKQQQKRHEEVGVVYESLGTSGVNEVSVSDSEFDKPTVSAQNLAAAHNVPAHIDHSGSECDE